MAKDYAKKSKKRNSASRFDKKKTNSNIPRWTWVLAGSLVIIITTVVVNLKLQSPVSPKTVTKKETPSAKSRYQAVPAEKASDTDLNFHDMLENKVVEIPKQTYQPSKKNTSDKRYIMQCGSFRKQSSAETLKAQIAMNGYTANIKKTKEKSGRHWFRVVLGPFISKRKAESQRHQLERNNINTCRIW